MKVNSKKAVFAVLFLILLLSAFALVYAQDEEVQQVQVSRGFSIRKWFSSIKSADPKRRIFWSNIPLSKISV